ncbi:glyoxalase superfamily protein [Kineococcus sp. NPDC059986]|jgi:catechol 2,3-dioxygenase-like lactoylglutathione lyase family enzyme|uniref:glyoxalase superfamily protein n=1 Tax=Kineococcus sp. NPDC059986 TaxID=3155538 RepID=UPI00344B0A01
MDHSFDTTSAKNAAQVLRRDLAARGLDVTHSAALELVAHQAGFRDWNTAAAAAAPTSTTTASRLVGHPVPVLRVQDGDAALEFYTAVLGFTCRWQHRFEPGLPLYTRVRRDDAELDLSEHYGDGTPGSVVWIPVRDVRALRTELLPRLAPRQQPGLHEDAPGGPTTTVLDPFGNTLRFCQQG